MSNDTSLSAQISWLRPFLFTIAISVLITGLARAGYMVWLGNRVAETGGFLFILAQGLRFDLIALAYLLTIPIAITPFLNSSLRVARYWHPVLRVYLLAVIGLFIFMEVATPLFISEYDIRPNYLFVEYLRYPKEVFSMLFVGYRIELIAGLVIVPLLLWPITRGLRLQVNQVRENRLLYALPLSFLTLLFSVAAARSTLDHRPVNASTVAFSPDTLVNSLPLSSLYSVANAIYEMGREDSGFPYGEVDEQSATAAIRSDMFLPDHVFADDSIPTARYQPARKAAEKPKNLVIIIEESLGAEFVGALGGLPLTPNLDQLSNEGIWFENLYATGTRSARGLEAIVTGFPPTTSQSVLKLGRAQKDFFTIGAFLKQRGFDTSFIYGGEAQFDNMRRFFANNGFDTVIDKHDFVNPLFLGSWGVSDEDVFDYAHAFFQSMPTDKPFVSVLFTTSNHSPWEFPDGKIELHDEPKATVNNAVKYADYAVGQYIREAKGSNYWDNTVFLIVSDHNSRVYGSEIVPIERFHIPGLILGGGIEPERWSRVASQIDLLPTLLSLVGVDGVHPAPGIDLTRPDIDSIPGRAVMQFRDTQAYRLDSQVVVLRKDKPAAMFHYVDKRLVVTEDVGSLREHAQAVAAWPSIAYRQRLYRLPPSASETTVAEGTN
jgi:phosphoglycerol transferase MdoB-like AlkP superfamily enzyme